MTEQVAVLKDCIMLRRPFLDNIFLNASDAVFDNYGLSARAELKNKDLVEGTSLYVQLVTYVIILNPARQKIFLAKRTGGDPRLLDTYSIGFGGHVSSLDYAVDNTAFINALDRCAERELREELRIQNKELKLTMIGYARDLDSDTSEHIGAVYFMTTGSASVKEKNNLHGMWVSYAEFKDRYYHDLESWGKAVFDYLYEDEKMADLLNLA